MLLKDKYLGTFRDKTEMNPKQLEKELREKDEDVEVKIVATIMSGRQREFYDQMIKDAKDCKVVPLSEALSKKDIQQIKSIIKPQPKMCYKNAHLLTNIIPGAVYVEGKVTCLGAFGIEHAWNKVGDKYVDITMELALGRDVNEEEYMSLGEYDEETITRITNRTEFYGNIYNELYKEKKTIIIWQRFIKQTVKC